MGLLLNSWTAPAWIVEVLQTIQLSEVAEITTVVIVDLEPPPTLPNLKHQLLETVAGRWALKNRLWELYLKFDTAWHKGFTAPFTPIDVRAIARSATVFNVEPSKHFVDRFPDALCASICDERLGRAAALPVLTSYGATY